ncbi:C40 family peptidase [Flammeovirga aprica]|uniref:C40 family peptidase n=1 Tax=Flammeovirga aprica JL-4 TaxID=694437 RepID=A0A7X9XCL6_9BACT|nr:NlpC/P60 family protein [Flammeovirga aprica]NME71860.1 C40 family peptidase [Flammeovirga aprica JL-4]
MNQRIKIIISICLSLFMMSCGGGTSSEEGRSSNDDGKSQTEKAELAVVTARDFIGTPYKSGGNSKDGIDASGLTMMSWEASGVKLARISREQARQGVHVNKEEAQSGDLIFFSQRKGSDQVSNCGIVSKVTKQGFNFIYTSPKDGVKEVAYSPYWKDRLVDIRRLGE